MAIRVASLNDAKALACLHKSSKVAGILGHLSSSALEKHFYAPLIASESSLVLVSESNEKEIICCLVVNYSWAKHRPLKIKDLVVIGIFAAIRFFRYPRILPMLICYFMSERNSSRCLSNERESVEEIQILLTDPDFQGNGYGTQILKHYFDITSKGSKVTLVKTQSTKALDFYQKMGFEVFLISSFFGNTIYSLKRLPNESV